jgi:hypothetical protein
MDSPSSDGLTDRNSSLAEREIAMQAFVDTAFETAPHAVSVPGGLARQYRVQYSMAPTAPWQMYGVYRQRSQAERCVENLNDIGFRARLVDYRCCPTAR